MKRVLLIVLFAVFLISVNLFAQNKNTFSLKEAMDYGLKNAYNNKTANLDYESAKKKVKEIITIGLPQINAGIDYNDFIQVPQVPLPESFSYLINSFMPPGSPPQKTMSFQMEYNLNPKINVSQIIFDGSYIMGLQASKIFQQFYAQGVKKSEIETRAAIAQSYYLVLVANENKKILSSTLEDLDKTLNETTQIQKNGFIEETDVDQIKLLKLNLSNTLNKITRQEQIAESLLKFQMGMKIDDNIILSDSLAGLLISNSSEEILQKNLELKNHIDYQMLTTNETLKNLNLKKEKFGYLPSLIAIFSYQQTTQNNTFNLLTSNAVWYPTTMWGLSLKIPVFDCGTKYFKIQQAKLDIEKTKVQQIQLEEGLKMEVQTSKSNFSSALDTYKKEVDNKELANKIYSKTLIKYKNGVSSSLDLTQAHNQYLTTEANYCNSVFELLNAKTKLDKALGNL
ncbi:MAG: TolC family protein [Bacteroidota bacterium]|nr:TolC family protein [Bacteroidota bacterium]